MTVIEEFEAAIGRPIEWYDIPDYMRAGLARYMLRGTPPGHFLTNVLCNDLMGALGRADDANLAALSSYGYFLYNQAPNGSYGSVEKFKAWVAQNGLTPPITSAPGFDGRASDASIGMTAGGINEN